MRVARVVRWGASGLLVCAALAAGTLYLRSSGAVENPLTTSALAASERYRFEGVVSERLLAGPYTYLLVQPARGPAAWVVTMGAGAAEHDLVSVRVVGRARDFESARLARRFSQLLFGIVRPAQAPSASNHP